MIKDQKVLLNGVEINNVREVSVKIETPGDRRGIYREPTFAATVTIVRDASEFATANLFEMATNEDGRKNILTSGTLEFHGDDVKEQYSFELNRYFISNWMLVNPSSPNAPTLESVVIKVGSLVFSAGGDSANFDLITFK